MQPPPLPMHPPASAPTQGREMKSIAIWQHVKSGGRYQIITSALMEDTGKLVVVYQNIDSMVVWVRSHAEFYDGRFVKVGEVNAKPLS